MTWNQGTLKLLSDPKIQFAEATGMVLTGLTFRVTATGWGLIVKAVDPVERKRKVMFLDAWTLEEVIELFYNVAVLDDNSSVWKEDKY